MKVVENALAEFLDTHSVGSSYRGDSPDESGDEAPQRPPARKYDNATKCDICRHEFVEGEAKGPKVRDTDHITGWFIVAAYRQCNLERPVSFKIPVFFHNFRGFDAYLIVHEFGKQSDGEIKVICQNMEKYLQVEWGKNMVFRDWLQFLCAPLEQLAASLSKLAAGIFKIFTMLTRMCHLRWTLNY